MSATALAASVRSGAVSAVSITEAALGRAAQIQKLNALLHLGGRSALDAAARVDAAVAEGRDPGPLAGVPIVLKDNLAHAGQPCGCASRILEGYIAPTTATAVARLEAAGAVVIGRANMDEFAMGSSNETSAYGPALNPWDTSRVPGGSSGGSAISVATGLCPISLGSETGGSVRQPASLCGVVGVKPTYGRVSRSGLVAFGSSVDQIGPMGRTVADAALALSVMSGLDPFDLTSADVAPPDPLAPLHRPVAGLRLGVPAECWGEGLSPGVRAACEGALAALEAQGAELVPVSVPLLALSIAIYQVLTASEASSNLARFDGVRYGPRADADSVEALYTATRSTGFGPEVQRRILLGTFALSAGYADQYYGRAVAAAARLRQDLDEVLRDVHAIVTPTSPTPAFKLGEKAADPLSMYLSDIFTAPANLVGAPAISVPCGLDEGLPVGVQIMGRRWDEETCFTLGAAVERHVGLLSPPGFG